MPVCPQTTSGECCNSYECNRINKGFLQEEYSTRCVQNSRLCHNEATYYWPCMMPRVRSCAGISTYGWST